LLNPEVTDVHSCGNGGFITSPVLHVNDTASMTVIDSLVAQQSTERGTIMSSGLSRLNIRHTTFTGNVAHTGAGLSIEDEGEFSATLYECNFHDNMARFGGAIGLAGNASFFIYKCRFTQNRAILGGAVWADMTQNLVNTTEGVGKTSSAARVTVMLSSFIDNTARSDGGALFVQWVDLRSNQSSFYNNTAGRRGGAMYIGNSNEINITDTKFHQNFATFQGGAIKGVNVNSFNSIGSVFSLNKATFRGGAFYLRGSIINIQNSTFTNNYCSKRSQYEL